MKKTYLPWMLFLCVLFLIGCAAGPNTMSHITIPGGHIAGFWLGLWHGLIAPFTLIISIFSNNVSCYEIRNNGVWYNLGFILGIASLVNVIREGELLKFSFKIR